MANLRQGSYGDYYGSTFSESEALTTDEMNVNALYITSYLVNKGWSYNAVSAILGNMQAESSLNPGRWQSDNVGNYASDGGYGLTQWTPQTKYLNWCSSQGFNDPSTMDNNLARIIYEVENNLQWGSNYGDITFKEFTTSEESIYFLSTCFVSNYEICEDWNTEQLRNYRANLGENWYTYITGNPLPDGGTTPDDETTSKKKRKKYNFVLFNTRRRMYGTR